MAPQEVGVELVPRNEIEAAELPLFWSAVFLAIATSVFGSFLSLVLSDFQNPPVVIVLGIFGGLFAGLTVVFALLGFRKRSRLRTKSMAQLRPRQSTPTSTPTRDHATLASTPMKDTPVYDAFLKYKVLYLLHSRIFLGRSSLSRSEFIEALSKVLQGEQSAEYRSAFVESLKLEGMLREVPGEPESTIEQAPNYRVDESFERESSG